MVVDTADQEEMEYMDDAQGADRAEENLMLERKKQMAQTSFFKKIWSLNDSCGMIILALITCMASGIIQPYFGRIMGDTLYVTSQDYT